MKSFIRFLLLLSFINFYSCDKEAIVDDSIVENNKIFNDQVITDSIEYARETRMQWVSFLIAQTIVGSESAEEFFMDVLANNPHSNIISIRSLLRPNSSDDNAFKEVFKSEFLFYASSFGCRFSEDPDGSPQNSNKPPPSSATSGEMSYEDLYIYSTLNDIEGFEFELYLPNGYTNIEAANEIVSSAYSLGISVENAQGYKHIARCNVDSVNVTPNHGGNLIILQYRKLKN